MMTREEFFAKAPAVETVDVDVPGVGRVRVRAMTAGARDRYEMSAQGNASTDVRARAVVASVVREDGKPLFVDADVAALSAMPAAVIEPIIAAIHRINAISAADVAELEKN